MIAAPQAVKRKLIDLSAELLFAYRSCYLSCRIEKYESSVGSVNVSDQLALGMFWMV